MSKPSSGQRDVALALKAWLHGDVASVRQIVKNTENKSQALLAAMGVCMFFLRQRQDALGLLDVLLEGDPLQDAARQEGSTTARARDFLRRELAGGDPKRVTVLRAMALSERIPTSALNNAAYQLGVSRGRRGDRDATWRLVDTV